MEQSYLSLQRALAALGFDVPATGAFDDATRSAVMSLMAARGLVEGEARALSRNRNAVRLLQRALDDLGHKPGAADGWFGPRTDAALMSLARAAGLLAPPAASGGEPWRGLGRRLDPWDYGRLGKLIGVGEDEIRAVVEVEAAGSGFFACGRLKMLPEGHVFWAELGEGPKRTRAEALGLAWRRWSDRRPYPASPDACYARLAQMIAIDRLAALRSCSWGMAQIMGYHHRRIGWALIDDMLRAFADDEEAQLRGMVEFIVTGGLDVPLRRHDWRAFAFGYNGPGYATHGYHTKLAAAFARWRRVPDSAP
jgi:peptidoglycan hydrolase-like protein with peptidoglycan-binding domain